MVEIRKATQDDFDNIMIMCLRLRNESPRYSHLGFNVEKLSNLVSKLIEDGSVFVAQKKKFIIGMISGTICEHLFSLDKFVCDLTVYIDPKHRGGMTAIKLIRAYEKWAVDLGISEIVLGVSTGINAERTVSLYKKLGYYLSGYSLIKYI